MAFGGCSKVFHYCYCSAIGGGRLLGPMTQTPPPPLPRPSWPSWPSATLSHRVNGLGQASAWHGHWRLRRRRGRNLSVSGSLSQKCPWRMPVYLPVPPPPFLGMVHPPHPLPPPKGILGTFSLGRGSASWTEEPPPPPMCCAKHVMGVSSTGRASLLGASTKCPSS